MQHTERTWVLSYDVTDDTRRAKLHRFMESRGHRVQYSVFEVIATAEGLERLVAEATTSARFDPSEDSLRVYPLCAACQTEVRVLGCGASFNAPGLPIIL
jgi:CRISPR-associated protein Cas2